MADEFKNHSEHTDEVQPDVPSSDPYTDDDEDDFSYDEPLFSFTKKSEEVDEEPQIKDEPIEEIEEHPMKKKSKKKKKLSIKKLRRTILIIAGAILGAFIVLYVCCIITVPKNTVAHHVMIENLDVGGLTYDDTLAAIEASYMFETQNITVECGGKTKELDGRSLSLTATPEATAQKAFNYGKSGNIFKDGLTAMRLLVSKKIIMPVAELNYDELDRQLGEFGIEVRGALTQVSVDFTDSEAVITPGSSGFDYNTDTARNQVLKAIDNDNFDNISVTLNTAKPDDIDVDYIDTAIYRDPADAYYDIQGDEITVVPEVYGRYCNRNDIEDIINSIHEGGDPISIPYFVSEPNIKADELQSKLFSDTLATYSTNFAAGGNRGKNVSRSAELINGAILAPGEVFSYNDRVGDRSIENGFFTAPEYVSGQSVEGVGGGTCQVSSTLYSAVLYADMGIVSRTEHMMTVSYMPLGQDATVVYGEIDFKFKNTSDYPIKISAGTSGGTITVSIIGTAWDPPRKVKLEHTSTQIGENTVVASVRKVYDNDGNLISTDQLRGSKYAPHKQTTN